MDQESEALTSLGFAVEHFERHSDDIDEWTSAQKATLPARVIWNPSTRRELTRELRRFAPDVVHIHNTFPILSPSVLYACRDERIPVVATLHNYKLLCASGDFFREGKVCHECAGGIPLPALVHRCYRGSSLATIPTVVAARVHRKAWRDLVSAYVFISASLRRLLAGMEFDSERIFVKGNMVPGGGTMNFRENGHQRENQVAYVGRLDQAKGIPLLLKAWDRYCIDAGNGGLRLVIAGAGPLEGEVERWAAARPSVELAGHLSKAACSDLIARSRAVLLPSQWEETFGLVVVEAMAAGVAPIASSHGSFPELITDGVDGVLFQAGDPDDLAKAIQDVAANRHRYDEYGRRARMTYEQKHNAQQNVEQLLDIYRFAIKRPAWA